MYFNPSDDWQQSPYGRFLRQRMITRMFIGIPALVEMTAICLGLFLGLDDTKAVLKKSQLDSTYTGGTEKLHQIDRHSMLISHLIVWPIAIVVGLIILLCYRRYKALNWTT